MKIFRARRGWFLTALFTMIMAITLPATAFGHDHGRRGRSRHLNKKCAKFVNCHDARDGRRDVSRLRRSRLGVRNVGQLNRRDRDGDRDRDRNLNNDNSLGNGRDRERGRDRDKRHDRDNDNR